MGKNSKKLNKKKNQQIVNEENRRVNELKAELGRQMRDMLYADALNTLAELIEKKCYEPDVIYQGAQAYFLIGDYERAATWVNNTLHYAPQHIDARLLLAKICLLEERVDDAMALYTFVLKNYPLGLTEAQLEEIKEGADYTWRTDQDWLMDTYPLVANLWEDKSMQMVPASDRNTQDADHKSDEMEPGRTEVASAADIVEQVLSKDSSLVEKVKLLNAFAGGYFVSRDFASAQLLLEKAKEIDGHHDRTLANLAVLAKMQGDVEKALAYVSEMSDVDFVLLQKIME